MIPSLLTMSRSRESSCLPSMRRSRLTIHLRREHIRRCNSPAAYRHRHIRRSGRRHWSKQSCRQEPQHRQRRTESPCSAVLYQPRFAFNVKTSVKNPTAPTSLKKHEAPCAPATEAVPWPLSASSHHAFKSIRPSPSQTAPVWRACPCSCNPEALQNRILRQRVTDGIERTRPLPAVRILFLYHAACIRMSS